jgi:hypothetical protein
MLYTYQNPAFAETTTPKPYATPSLKRPNGWDMSTDTPNPAKKPNMQTENWNHASTINRTNSPQKSATLQPSTQTVVYPSIPSQMVAYETPYNISATQFHTDNSARPQRNRHPPKKYTELGGDSDTIIL